MQWNWAYPFEAHVQDFLLQYTTLPGATPSVRESIRNAYRNSILDDQENLPAYTAGYDPYRAYIKDYTWGSNNTHARQGQMHHHLIT
jgi:hypothetical protein